MTQQIILREAKKFIAANNLPKIRELLSSIDEIPNTDTVSEILKEAADYRRWELVREICTMQSDNKPSLLAVDYALSKSYSLNNLEEFKFICAESITKPSQKNIEELLKKAHTYPHKWDFVENICFLDSEYKPRQPGIDDALKDAADNRQWPLVRKICEMVGENKPSSSAIDHALSRAFVTNELEEFKFICAKSVNKPSQKNIEDLLNKAHTFPHKWDFVENICFLDSEYKPGKIAIDAALKDAADNRQWPLVRKICEMAGENKPSSSAIDHALGRAFVTNQLEEFKFICAKSVNKPSQKNTEDLLKKAHTFPHKWDFVENICFLDSKYKPGQIAIDAALNDAADNRQWPLVRKICEMPGENKPSSSAIDHALGRAFVTNELEEFKFICAKSVNKPSQKNIEDLLKKAHTFPHKWDFVENICFLDSEYKPGKITIDAALKDAADNRQWLLVRKICEMVGENKPSSSAIDHALGRAFVTNELEEFKFIYAKSVNKPSQKNIEDLLKKAHTYPHKWDFVENICFLDSEYKPKQPAIDAALKDAADNRQWPLVKKMYLMESNNKPSQSPIEYVLVKAAKSNQLEIVQDICELPGDSCPRALAVGDSLVGASERGNVEIVRFFSEMKTENKPEPKAFIDAFLLAATNGRIQVVQYFCQLETENQPTEEIVGQALIFAASKGRLNIIQFLLGEDNPLKPQLEDVAEAFANAISEGYVYLIDYFANPENKLELGQETMDKGLLAAVTAPNGLVIIKRFIEINKTTKTLSEKGVEEALLKAKVEGKTDISFFLSQGITEASSPAQNPQEHPPRSNNIMLLNQMLQANYSMLFQIMIWLQLKIFVHWLVMINQMSISSTKHSIRLNNVT